MFKSGEKMTKRICPGLGLPNLTYGGMMIDLQDRMAVPAGEWRLRNEVIYSSVKVTLAVGEIIWWLNAPKVCHICSMRAQVFPVSDDIDKQSIAMPAGCLCIVR